MSPSFPSLPHTVISISISSHLFFLPTTVMRKLHPSPAPAVHLTRSHKQTQTCDGERNQKKLQQKSFCLHKQMSRQNAWTAQWLTAPGPGDEVRNQINKGGSWHR